MARQDLGATAPARVSHPRLKIENLPLDALHPDPKNPRKHTTRQIRQIAASVDEFGFLVPILIDQESGIIAGHGRFEAARLCGMAEVPTVRVEHLTSAQIRAFMIADNRLTENGEWDDQLLALTFKELSKLDLDF